MLNFHFKQTMKILVTKIFYFCGVFYVLLLIPCKDFSDCIIMKLSFLSGMNTSSTEESRREKNEHLTT